MKSSDAIDVGRLERLAYDIATLHQTSNNFINFFVIALEKNKDLAIFWLNIFNYSQSFRFAPLGVKIGQLLLKIDGIKDAQRAGIINNLAIRLNETGDRQEAREMAHRAVEIRERLAQDNPAAYLPDLAMSLNNLANRLSETGDRQEAREMARRAVEIYQDLVEKEPAAFERYLAISQRTLKSLEE